MIICGWVRGCILLLMYACDYNVCSSSISLPLHVQGCGFQLR